MKNIAIIVCVAAALAASTFVLAQAQGRSNAQHADPRIDRLIEQNEQILKTQQEILKSLEALRSDVLQLRRRSS